VCEVLLAAGADRDMANFAEAKTAAAYCSDADDAAWLREWKASKAADDDAAAGDSSVAAAAATAAVDATAAAAAAAVAATPADGAAGGDAAVSDEAGKNAGDGDGGGDGGGAEGAAGERKKLSKSKRKFLVGKGDGDGDADDMSMLRRQRTVRRNSLSNLAGADALAQKGGKRGSSSVDALAVKPPAAAVASASSIALFESISDGDVDALSVDEVLHLHRRLHACTCSVTLVERLVAKTPVTPVTLAAQMKKLHAACTAAQNVDWDFAVMDGGCVGHLTSTRALDAWEMAPASASSLRRYTKSRKFKSDAITYDEFTKELVLPLLK
jgi:hypothetical protein